jgi:hypothetical protein
MTFEEEMERFFRAYKRQRWIAEKNLNYQAAARQRDAETCQRIAIELINGNAQAESKYQAFKVRDIPSKPHYEG